MRTFGLVGFPLTHSFSQKYFSEKFVYAGITDAEYKNFSIPSINHMIEVMNQHPNLCGFNITIPYKKQIIEFLHTATPAVQQMGACNCVLIKNKIISGYNTDIVGFKQSLLPYLKPHHTKALVLGTGGAAAAVEYVLNELNILYQFVSRTPKEKQLNYTQLTPAIIKENTLIINTSPVGQYPNIADAPAIPYEYLGPDHHLFDLIYNPSQTTFLKYGQKYGSTFQNGYEMLVLQAEESWRIWNS